MATGIEGPLCSQGLGTGLGLGQVRLGSSLSLSPALPLSSLSLPATFLCMLTHPPLLSGDTYSLQSPLAPSIYFTK